MSELVVVFVLCASSAMVVVSHARSLVGSTAQRRELDRLLAAVDRACADFLAQETRLLALLLGVVGAALCVPLLLWRWQQPHGGARLGFNLLYLVLGGAVGAALARLAHWAAARATARALAALRDAPESASSAAFRGALLLSLAIDTASSLLCSVAFLGYHRYATGLLQLDAAAALQEATRGMPVMALGAVGAALVFQVGGSSFQTAARVQATAAVQSAPGNPHDAPGGSVGGSQDEQNPALVAELVGDHVGGLVSRSSDVFAALMLTNVALIALSGAVVSANPALTAPASMALVALPLLVRATGSLAAAVATGSLRIGPGPIPWQAFAGAGLSQALMAATGLLGAAFWLLGTPLYLYGFGAGMLGILASMVCQVLLLAPRGPSSLVSLRQGSAGSATSLARALGLGLQRAWPPLLSSAVCLGAAHALGARTGLSHGGAYTLLLAVAGMAGSGGLHLCCSAFSSIASSIRRLGALRRAHYDLAARSRASELERAGLAIGNLGDIQAILCGTAAALLGALTLPLLDASRSPLPPFAVTETNAGSAALPSLAQPIMLLGAFLGLASLSFYVGGVLQNGSRAASAADEELSRDGQALSREALSPDALPRQTLSNGERDSQPSTMYRASVLRAGRVATAALLPLTASTLLAPLAMGILLRLLCGPEGSKLAGHSLMAVASISALTGGCAALAARGALMALGRTRLVAGSSFAGSPSARKPPFSADALPVALNSADSASTLIGHSVGPAALLGLKATVASALVIVPLLSLPGS